MATPNPTGHGAAPTPGERDAFLPNPVAYCFAKNLVRARKRLGLSQEELGHRATLHRTEIGLLERGDRIPRIDTVLKLADSLDIELDALVDGITWNRGATAVGQFSVGSDR
jgi:transcriptional regulator with XRE-family HTH domain